MKKYLFNKNSEYILLISIIMVAIFSVLILSISVAYFQTKKEIGGEITLGELDYKINVDYDENLLIMPGDDVPMKIFVENKVLGKNNLIPFYFRFKVLNGIDDYDKDLLKIETSDYIFDNSFFYYKHKVGANETAKLINSIIVPTTLTESQSELFDLKVLVEAVQSENGAYKDVFYDAPSEWVEFIENN